MNDLLTDIQTQIQLINGMARGRRTSRIHRRRPPWRMPYPLHYLSKPHLEASGVRYLIKRDIKDILIKKRNDDLYQILYIIQ